MLEEHPKEKLQEIYEILPEDLRQALFSQEIADMISDICVDENISEKQIDKISKYVGYVILGILSPNDLEKTIKEDLFLEEPSARRINQQILRLIFLPLKTSLELIHKTEIELPSEITEEKIAAKEKTSQKEEASSKRQGKDVYREPVE